MHKILQMRRKGLCMRPMHYLPAWWQVMAWLFMKTRHSLCIVDAEPLAIAGANGHIDT